MPEVENGLFSRFMYYAFEDDRGFLNPFESFKDVNYDYFFTTKGFEVHHFYQKLMNLEQPIKFELTKEQAQSFVTFFQTQLEKNKLLMAKDLDANTKRLGVITFRIAMLLSTLRIMDQAIGKPMPKKIICSDTDFTAALSIASILERHAVAVYQNMPKVNLKGLRLVFFEKLPQQFTRAEYLAIAKELKIPDNTADKYIKLFKGKLLDHEWNSYNKKNLE